MKLRKIRQGIVLVVVASSLGLGCELIVDFDRTKIPVDATDSSTAVGDGSIDASLDVTPADASTSDADAGDAADADAADGSDAADD